MRALRHAHPIKISLPQSSATKSYNTQKSKNKKSCSLSFPFLVISVHPEADESTLILQISRCKLEKLNCGYASCFAFSTAGVVISNRGKRSIQNSAILNDRQKAYQEATPLRIAYYEIKSHLKWIVFDLLWGCNARSIIIEVMLLYGKMKMLYLHHDNLSWILYFYLVGFMMTD